MAKPVTKPKSVVRQLDRRVITLKLIGNSGMFFNSMSAKAMRDLLVPPKRKTAAERLATMKHQPVQEFGNSIYKRPKGSDTLIGFPAAGFKAALATAALVSEGITKSDVQKLVYVEGELVPVYGHPYLRMDTVRSADMAKTPDVRTRAFMPEWASEITISYVMPNLTDRSIINLLWNAGEAVGVGDFRQEKGRGNFGRFRVVATPEDEALHDEIKAAHTYASQQAAIAKAEPYDEAAEALLDHFNTVVEERGLKLVS